ncbi:MAG: adenosylcobinamide-phosphate synthase, partial [Candidatus Altiarchaeales archaeon HGW-Altiarchaeales-3]
MFEIIYILILALTIDLIFGEPKNRIHPVAGFGKLIGIIFKNNFILTHKSGIFKKIYGIILPIALVLLCILSCFELLNIISEQSGIAFILISAIILKFTFSIRAMEEHANAVSKELRNRNIMGARNSVSMLVGRETKNLNEKQIISAAIESVSENLVDGIMSPVFYF